MIYLRRIVGDSMKPAYRNGQLVVISVFRGFKVGDVVVAMVNRREVIKRITQIANGKVYLEGDNASASTDSREYGWVQDRHIVGKVVFPRKKRQL